MNKTFLTSFTIICLLFTVFLVELSYIQPVKASGTIYIRANGSIDPSTASIHRDGNTYTFTDNINDSIEIERGNIVIDGAGFTLDGTAATENFGINAMGEEDVVIQSVKITAFKSAGIMIGYGSLNTEISGNEIVGNGFGILSQVTCTYNTISENNITNCLTAIHFFESSHNTISGNNIAHNDYGIALMSESHNNVISENDITDNTEAGVRLNQADENTISQNRMTNNGKAIFFDYDGRENSIVRNNITRNDYGVLIDGGYCSNNIFHHNNFINNTVQVYNRHSALVNIWDDGYNIGNYWSDYGQKYPNATKTDGIWDTPYVIDEGNQDNYPIIPEFPSIMVLPLLMIFTVAVVVLSKKKRHHVNKPI